MLVVGAQEGDNVSWGAGPREQGATLIEFMTDKMHGGVRKPIAGEQRRPLRLRQGAAKQK
eukprot:9921002-Prorocentrum_lima.AAC.1